MVFEGKTMRYNQVDLLYQHALKYYHHAENYQQSILQDITLFGLRLKKKLQSTLFLLTLTANGMEYLKVISATKLFFALK